MPEPIPNDEGSLIGYVTVDAPEPNYCVLLRWVPGRQKVTDMRPADLSLVGSYVAQLHLHSERYAVPEGFARPHV